MEIQDKILALREELTQHNYNYYVLDNPTISDFEFDLKLKELKRDGFSIAAITDSMISPIAYMADPIVNVPITISSIFDIYSTPLVFLNLLLRDVAQEITGLDQRLNKLERLEASNHIYYKNIEV